MIQLVSRPALVVAATVVMIAWSAWKEEAAVRMSVQSSRMPPVMLAICAVKESFFHFSTALYPIPRTFWTRGSGAPAARSFFLIEWIWYLRLSG